MSGWNSLALRNARVVAPDRIIDSSDLLIERGRIARICSAAESVEAASSIDLRGFTLYPGFIDVHIHGAIGVDTLKASANDLREVGRFLASNGVTAWLPTLVPAAPEAYEQAVAAVRTVISERLQPNPEAPEFRIQSGIPEAGKSSTEAGARNAPHARVLGVHYEGPFVNTEQCGALHCEYFRTFANTAALNTLPTIDLDRAVHMMTLAPEVEGGVELIKELKRRGWIVSIGHTRADVEVLDQAFAAGACHMTHFMNAMSPLHHRALGAVGWGLSNQDVTFDLIADGIHIDPAILRVLVRAKGSQRISLISDAIAASGMGDGEYQIWGEKISVKDGRTQNARGSIAGSVITMLEAVRMMRSLEVPENEVARMAATNPAQLLRVDKDCGSIEEEKQADLVALDERSNIRLTIIGGEIAYSN